MRTLFNAEKTLAVVLDDDGTVSVATREHPSDMWSPPEELQAPEDLQAAERAAFRARVDQARIGY